MDITKIALLGLIGAIFAVLLKDNSPVFALMISVITTLVVFIFVMPKLYEITELFDAVSENVNTEYISVLIKSVAVAYGAMFSSQLCRDFGQNAIGDKVELGGKIIIMGLAVPVITGLIKSVLNIL